MLSLIVPDLHVPFNDKRRTGKMLDWARKNKPGRVVLLGDVLEVHALSTHRKDPRWEDCLHKELAAGRKFLEELRAACPKSDITYIEGNHELRWRSHFQNRTPVMRLLGITIDSYLGLGDLGIRWHSGDRKRGVGVPCGQGKKVYCYHGHYPKMSGKISGNVAQALAAKRGHSVHIGHTHKVGGGFVNVGGKRLFGFEGGHLVNESHPVFEYGGVNPPWMSGFSVYDSERRDSCFPHFITP